MADKKKATTPPVVTGQRLLVLDLIRRYQPILSLTLTGDYSIPETAARISELRAKGFNIQRTILPDVDFRGQTRHNVAQYWLGSPEWPRPGFFEEVGSGDAD
jgi:hypothetical protein